MNSQILTRKQQLLQFILGSISLYVAIDLLGSIDIDDFWLVIVAVLFIQILQSLLNPVFKILSKYFGLIGILLTSLFGSALIVWLCISVILGFEGESFWDAFFTAWLYALFMTLANWILVSQSEDVFFAEVIKHAKVGKNSKDKGTIFVQLDGVSAPVLEWQIKTGNLPNIASLLRDHNYSFNTWHTDIPSTTPVSQAGILLGSNSDMPAFRWYEKSSNKLIVANQPEGAEEIEKRHSSGNGLLSNGGVSVGNLFSGDAMTNIMVMSKVSGDRESIKSMREYYTYFLTPLGFMRSFILSIGEMVKEIYQARKQTTLDMKPRIKRHGSYILLRAVTNVIMRDLQTTIVIQNMLSGVNSLYVDYLDYDEVAHHAGIARKESLDSLSGLDKVVGHLFRAKELSPREYDIIFVSDHGQSQGPTFKQLHSGKGLREYIREFIDKSDSVEEFVDAREEQSVARTLIAQQEKGSRISEATAKAVKKSLDKRLDSTELDNKSDIVITGSGNLGNIWLNYYKKRALLEDINKDYPNLINKIIALEGVGYLLVKSKAGHIIMNLNGRYNFDNQKIVGTNLLENIPKTYINKLQRLIKMKNAPDICLISSHDPDTDEVHAFEELVGNHGGFGGWQTEAILLHPDKLEIPSKYLEDGEIHGAENLHKILKSWTM